MGNGDEKWLTNIRQVGIVWICHTIEKLKKLNSKYERIWSKLNVRYYLVHYELLRLNCVHRYRQALHDDYSHPGSMSSASQLTGGGVESTN